MSRIFVGVLAGALSVPFCIPAAAQPTPASEYQYAMRAHLARFQYGPRQSRDQHGGRVEVAIRLDPRGRLLGTAVVRSSCSEALEQAALASVRAADPFPVMAGSSVARKFSVVVIFQPITRSWQYRMSCTPGGRRTPDRG